MTEYQAITGLEPLSRSGAIKLHGPQGFEGMRRAGRAAAAVLDALVPHVLPGVTTQAIDFSRSFRIKSSGSFAYRGSASYLRQTSTGYKSKIAVASLSGKFVRSTLVTGTVKGGPGACRSVKFSATFNPKAH